MYAVGMGMGMAVLFIVDTLGLFSSSIGCDLGVCTLVWMCIGHNEVVSEERRVKGRYITTEYQFELSERSVPDAVYSGRTVCQPCSAR
jgi:hypothetical protein